MDAKDCEIVENQANGIPFQYCRTHKVESKDCPGKVSTSVVFDKTGLIAPREELKVGDRVRILVCVKCPQLKGRVGTVTKHEGSFYLFDDIYYFTSDDLEKVSL